nr:hypothetical protein [Bacillota bacterium]
MIPVKEGSEIIIDAIFVITLIVIVVVGIVTLLHQRNLRNVFTFGLGILLLVLSWLLHRSFY